MNPVPQIADAYRRWGITPGKTKDIIVIKLVVSLPEDAVEPPAEPKRIPPTQDEIWTHLREAIKGTPVPLSDEEIAKSTDWQKIRKYYSLNAVPALAAVKDEEVRLREMERLAVMKMALRGL